MEELSQHLGGGGAMAGTWSSLMCSFSSASSFPGHPAAAPPAAAKEASSSSTSWHEVEAIKAKIISHPHYSSLLSAYLDCQKVGAPPEVASRLTAVAAKLEAGRIARGDAGLPAPMEPELDQFMEAYHEMLVKYREELARPFQESMDFLRRVEAQLSSLSLAGGRSPSVRNFSGNGSPEEEGQEGSGGEAELTDAADTHGVDQELKHHLLKKYSGYLGSLKQELSKKKKKGKLPKDARQQLLSWWDVHYKWPYPSETQKVALAESTGLDLKQINNWFINQRKRHWKPSDEVQFAMEGYQPPSSAAAAFYMGGAPPFVSDGSGALYRFGPSLQN